MKNLIVVFSLIVAVNCWPPNYGNGMTAFRSKRQHGMAFTGFYMNPMGRPAQEIYQEPLNLDVPPHEEPYANIEGPTEINEIVPHTSQETVTEKPLKTSTISEEKVDSDEKDDKNEEDNDSWPIFMPNKKGSKGRVPSMNFFPIMFGSPSGRSGGIPEGSIAIANSFSTGRKGMAVSNALAGADTNGFMRRANLGQQQD